DDVLLENPDISQALNIVERSAYTDADMYAYEDYLLEVMTQRNSMKSERAEGREEGAQSEKLETAKRMKAKGFDNSTIAELTQLPINEIAKL
ncbi:MAG: hypothetical protein PUC50_09525, partial [Bacteroidales bacterium]|nr:hypothetical protein [Bacteroidales bacterium]